ncbi:MAG: SRPBCC domain-containing protein [Planctomycetota bacterium]
MTKPLSVTITRTFKAPIDLVYQAWVDPQQVVRWMKCDPGVELAYEGWSPAVGTTFTSVMAKPGEWEVRGTGRFVEVEPQRVLAYVTDANPQMQMPEMQVRVEFEATGDGTTLTLTHTGLPNDDMCGIVKGGWTNGLQQLEELLAVSR